MEDWRNLDNIWTTNFLQSQFPFSMNHSERCSNFQSYIPGISRQEKNRTQRFPLSSSIPHISPVWPPPSPPWAQMRSTPASSALPTCFTAPIMFMTSELGKILGPVQTKFTHTMRWIL